MSANSGGDNGQSLAAPGSQEAYLAGQAFDPALVPGSADNKELMESAVAYAQYAGFKAISFSQGGAAFVLQCGDRFIASQEECNRLALERCQLVFDNQPCALFAAADVIQHNASDFPNAHVDMFQNIPQDFDPLRLPGQLDHWKANTAENYFPIEEGRFHSLAVDKRGSSRMGWSSNSQEEASRRALEFCAEMSYGERPCFLHTVGAQTIWNPADTQWLENILTFGTVPLDPMNVPFIRDEQRLQVSGAAAKVQRGIGHAIVLMSNFGRLFRVIEQATPFTEAEKQAEIDRCNARAVENHPPETHSRNFQVKCFIYSEDLQVVWTKDTYGAAVHAWHPSNQTQ